jgi:hypothetical protein
VNKSNASRGGHVVRLHVNLRNHSADFSYICNSVLGEFNFGPSRSSKIEIFQIDMVHFLVIALSFLPSVGYSFIWLPWSKGPGCKADHSPLSNSVKNAWRFTSILPYIFMECFLGTWTTQTFRYPHFTWRTNDTEMYNSYFDMLWMWHF